MKSRFTLLLILLAVLSISSCQKKDEGPESAEIEAAANKIHGKWNFIKMTSNVYDNTGAQVGNHEEVGESGDYYEFKDDNTVIANVDGEVMILGYNIVNANTIAIENEEGGERVEFTIKTLTDIDFVLENSHSVEEYRSETVVVLSKNSHPAGDSQDSGSENEETGSEDGESAEPGDSESGNEDSGSAEPQTAAEKILGKWTLSQTTYSVYTMDGAPMGSDSQAGNSTDYIQFNNNGTFSLNRDGELDSGTYVLLSDTKIEITVEDNGAEEVHEFAIKTLTSTKLIWEAEGEGVESGMSYKYIIEEEYVK